MLNKISLKLSQFRSGYVWSLRTLRVKNDPSCLHCCLWHVTEDSSKLAQLICLFEFIKGVVRS
jgi:hypothetical protein